MNNQVNAINPNNYLNKNLLFLNTHIPSPLKKTSLLGNLWEIAEKIAMVVIYPFVWLATKVVNFCFSNRVIIQQVPTNYSPEEVNSEEESEDFYSSEEPSKMKPYVDLQPFKFDELIPELQRHIFGFLTLQDKCQLLYTSKVMKAKFEINVDLQKNNLQKVLSHPNLLKQLQESQNDTRLFFHCIHESIDYEALPTFCIKNLFKSILAFATPEQISNFLGPIVMKQDSKKKLPSVKLTQIFFQELNESSIKYLLSIRNCLDFFLPLCAIDLVRDPSNYRLDFFDKIIDLAFENDPHNPWWIDLIGVYTKVKKLKNLKDSHTLEYPQQQICYDQIEYWSSFAYLSRVVCPYYLKKSDDSNINEFVINDIKTIIEEENCIIINTTPSHTSSTFKKILSKDGISDFKINLIFNELLRSDYSIPLFMQSGYHQHVFSTLINNDAKLIDIEKSLKYINTKEKAISYIETVQTSQLTNDIKYAYLQFLGDLSTKDYPIKEIEAAFTECNLSISNYPKTRIHHYGIEREEIKIRFFSSLNNIKSFCQFEKIIPIINEILNLIKTQETNANFHEKMTEISFQETDVRNKCYAILIIGLCYPKFSIEKAIENYERQCEFSIDQMSVNDLIRSTIDQKYTHQLIDFLMEELPQFSIDHLLQFYKCKYGQKNLQTICKNIENEKTAFSYVKVITESKLPAEAISLYLRSITSQYESIKRINNYSPILFHLAHKQQSLLSSIFSHFNLEIDDYPPIPDSVWDPEESIEALVNKIALEA
jgi:hypothetical protein